MLAPVRDALATAANFLLNTLSAALSLAPSLVGAYCTVTLHDFCGPRLAAVHVSAVFENADAPARLNHLGVEVATPEDVATHQARLTGDGIDTVAEPPELVSVNVCDAVVPESIGP